jgi:peroxiredoxin
MAILEAGALASHFTLLGLDGREYSLPRSLEGKPALLVFFKTSCATCDLTFPYLNQLHVAYPDGWRLWAISQDVPDRSSEYARRFGISYPVLIDAPEYAASRLYDPPATPTLFLVGPDGRVEYATHGFSKDDVNEISGLLAGHLGAEAVVIAPEKDGNPPFKPG